MLSTTSKARVRSFFLPKNRSIFITANGIPLDKSIARGRNSRSRRWDEIGAARRGAAPHFRKKHKNAYYRFRNTAISLKSARLSFIKRKQILMYFYTRPPVLFRQPLPSPPPTPSTPPDAADAKLQRGPRGVEAKSNYFYSGEMSAAKSLILINGPDSDQPARAHRPGRSTGITHNSNGSK